MTTRLEFEQGNSAKFWEIALDGSETTVTYGKIGTAGRSQTKKHASKAAAKKFVEKQIAAKEKKGYAKVDGNSDEDESAVDEDEEDEHERPKKKLKRASKKAACVPLIAVAKPSDSLVSGYGIFADKDMVVAGFEDGRVLMCTHSKKIGLTITRMLQLSNGVKAIAMDAGQLFCGTNDGEIFDITNEPRSLVKIENFDNIYWLDVFDGCVAAANQDGEVVWVSAEGEIIWRVGPQRWSVSGTPSAAWMCRVDADGVYVGHVAGVEKLSLADGSLLWATDEVRGINFGTQTPTHVFVTGSGTSAMLTKEDGKIVQTFPVGGPSCASNATGSTFVCCQEAYNKRGEQLWAFEADYSLKPAELDARIKLGGMSAAIVGTTLFTIDNTLNMFDIAPAAIKRALNGTAHSPVQTIEAKGVAVEAVSTTVDAVNEGDVDGITVHCIAEGSKVRVRVERGQGLDTSFNVQFPRALRTVGARYVCEEILLATQGGFYRAKGSINQLN